MMLAGGVVVDQTMAMTLLVPAAILFGPRRERRQSTGGEDDGRLPFRLACLVIGRADADGAELCFWSVSSAEKPPG